MNITIPEQVIPWISKKDTATFFDRDCIDRLNYTSTRNCWPPCKQCLVRSLLQCEYYNVYAGRRQGKANVMSNIEVLKRNQYPVWKDAEKIMDIEAFREINLQEQIIWVKLSERIPYVAVISEAIGRVLCYLNIETVLAPYTRIWKLIRSWRTRKLCLHAQFWWNFQKKRV